MDRSIEGIRGHPRPTVSKCSSSGHTWYNNGQTEWKEMSNWGEVSKYSTVVEQSCDTLSSRVPHLYFRTHIQVCCIGCLVIVGVNWEWFSITINRQANVQNITQEASAVVWLQQTEGEGEGVGDQQQQQQLHWTTLSSRVCLFECRLHTSLTGLDWTI